MNAILQIIAAALGSVGFAALYHVRGRFYFSVAAGGAICWAVYLAALKQVDSVFWAGLFSSAATALFAEAAARWKKTPSSIFFVPCVIPLVPGGSLYYAISSAIQGNRHAALLYARDTILIAFSIAAGASLVWAYGIMRWKYRLLKKSSH